MTHFSTRSMMYGNRDLSDADLLRVAAATALSLSQSSSLVCHLTSQFSTEQIGTPMDTTTTAVTTGPIRTSGPHVPVKLLPFDSKQPNRWFQQTDAIFHRSHVVLSQDKWDYVLLSCPLTSSMTSAMLWTVLPTTPPICTSWCGIVS